MSLVGVEGDECNPMVEEFTSKLQTEFDDDDDDGLQQISMFVFKAQFSSLEVMIPKRMMHRWISDWRSLV